jgi:hypothetical protein
MIVNTIVIYFSVEFSLRQTNKIAHALLRATTSTNSYIYIYIVDVTLCISDLISNEII